MKNSRDMAPLRAAHIRVLLAVICLALVAAPVFAEEGSNNSGQECG
jgi:hypothetical protein